MRIISIIENGDVIQVILKQLGLWLVRSKPPPKIHAPPLVVVAHYPPYPHPSPDTHFLRQAQDSVYADPDYSWDEYIQS
jgi:hypothetical protein